MKLNKCKQCGNNIPVPYRANSKYFISPANYQKRMFCDNNCRSKWQKEHRVGSNNPNYKGGNSTCVDCDIMLPHRYSHKEKPRCRACWYKYNVGTNNPNYKGKNFCVDCGCKTSYGYNRCRVCYGLSNGGKNNPMYKDDLSYKYLHSWVKSKLGSPLKCEHCGIEGKNHKGNWSIHWANKSGNYLRDLDDWIGLCPLCHVRYDKKN